MRSCSFIGKARQHPTFPTSLYLEHGLVLFGKHLINVAHSKVILKLNESEIRQDGVLFEPAQYIRYTSTTM